MLATFLSPPPLWCCNIICVTACTHQDEKKIIKKAKTCRPCIFTHGTSLLPLLRSDVWNVFGFCFSFSMFTRTTVAAAEEAGGKTTRTPTCLYPLFSFLTVCLSLSTFLSIPFTMVLLRLYASFITNVGQVKKKKMTTINNNEPVCMRWTHERTLAIGLYIVRSC